MSDDESMEAVRAWAQQLAPLLGVDPAAIDLDGILGAAGLAARAVVRPAAPVTTFLIGCAVGQAGDDAAARAEAFASALAVVRSLTQTPLESPRVEQP